MYKVLIVEDDPMVAMINEKYIKRNKSFEVVGKCIDTEQALLFLENNEVDLLILDVNMPNGDGFELLREIRKRQLPVDAIMVTASSSRQALEKALHLGAVDYVLKPFSFERFQLALEKYMWEKAALSNIEILTQPNIDRIIANCRKKNDELFPKGIQEKTLSLILAFLNNNKGIWFTGEEIAKETSLTAVTVRRYMSYLDTSGKVMGKMNYETGGRPSMRYKAE